MIKTLSPPPGHWNRLCTRSTLGGAEGIKLYEAPVDVDFSDCFWVSKSSGGSKISEF